jgi:hypothetical protein
MVTRKEIDKLKKYVVPLPAPSLAMFKRTIDDCCVIDPDDGNIYCPESKIFKKVLKKKVKKANKLGRPHVNLILGASSRKYSDIGGVEESSS